MIGFKVNDELYEIHELSGNNANSIACLDSPRTIWSNVVYQLRKLVTIVALCILCPVMFVFLPLFRFAGAAISVS